MSDSPKFCYSKKSHVPSQGWWVKCPIVDEVVRGGDFGDMVKKCEQLIISKGITPPIDLVSQIEHNLCDRMAGHPNCVPCKKVKQTLGFGEIVRWVKAMYHFAKDNKFQLVDQEEAERRAKICAACPHQIQTSGCWGCKGIAGMLPHIAGARKTSYDAQLKACGVCGCYSAIAVHLPIDSQGGENLEFPDFCWKFKQPQIG
jgi:hypothetical protein